MAPRKASKTKDPNAPKKPLGSYFLFVADYRKRHPEEKGNSYIKTAASEWKTLDEKAKNMWKVRAEEDKDRYSREMAAYRNK